MSTIEIKIPEVGQTTSEVTLVKWRKQVGDAVRRGDVLAELETDKMVVELESFAAGRLAGRRAEEGAIVAVGAVVAVLESATPAAKAAMNTAEPSPSRTHAPAGSLQESQRDDSTSARHFSAGSAPGEIEESHRDDRTPALRYKASPAAKALARERNIDLAGVEGTGVDGLIIRRNVTDAGLASASSTSSTPATAPPDLLDRHRLATGRAMSRSKREVPHFYLEIEVRADALEDDRARRNENAPADARLTVTDYLVAACARALREHPRFNSVFRDDRIIPYPEIHIGLATAAPQGLALPAIAHADRLALAGIAAARRALIERTRQGRADAVQPTFTISNLGMHGITRFSAIIPPGQSAILAAGAITRRLVLEGDAIRNARFMTLTLSIDHRVADGVEGAQFLADLRDLLESRAESL